MNKNELNHYRTTLEPTFRETREAQSKTSVRMIREWYLKEAGLPLIATHIGSLKYAFRKTKQSPDRHMTFIGNRIHNLDISFECSVEHGNFFALGVDDYEMFKTFLKENEYELPETLTHESRENRYHYVFQAPRGYLVPNANLEKTCGFDIMGEGKTIPCAMNIYRKSEPNNVTVIKMVKQVKPTMAPEWLIDFMDRICVEVKDRVELNWEFVDVSGLKLTERLRNALTKPNGNDRSGDVFYAACCAYEDGLKDDQIVTLIHESRTGQEYYNSGKNRNIEALVLAVAAAKAHILDDVGGRDLDELMTTTNVGARKLHQTSLDMVTTHAHRITMDLLQHYGNRPSDTHKEAIRVIHDTFSKLIDGTAQGRHCLPLPAGYGKTTSIIGYLKALNLFGLLGRVRVAILSTRVEQGCEGYRAAIEVAGIDPDLISLVHSKLYNEKYVDALPDGYASESAVLDPDRPVVFLTHAKARRDGGEVKDLVEGSVSTSYLQDRDLVLWDESFITGDSSSVDFADLKDEVAILRGRLEERHARTPNYYKEKVKDLHGFITFNIPDFDKEREAFEYLQECIRNISQTVLVANRMKQLIRLDLPEVELSKRFEFIHHLMDVFGEQLRTKDSKIKAIKRFLKMDDVATFPKGKGNVILKTVLTINDDLCPNMAILDASAEIRYLQTIDPTVHAVEMPELELSFDQCNINRLPFRSGRVAVLTELATGKEGLLDTLTELVKSKPDEAFLFFMLKHRPTEVNATEVFQKKLREEGVDLEALLDGRPQYNWLTAGNETASNAYNHVTNVVFVGFVHVPEDYLHGVVAAQLRDLDERLNTPSYQKVKLGELAYAIHQGACRGAMRKVDDDQALPTDVYYCHHDDSLKPLLEKVFNGASWGIYQSKSWSPTRKADQMAMLIVSVLESLEMGSISSKELKPMVLEQWEGDEKARALSALYTRGMEKVQRMRFDWNHKDRSWYREV